MAPGDRLRAHTVLQSPSRGREGLVAAIAFLEGEAWGCWELTCWFEEHSISPQWVTRTPPSICEHEGQLVVLDPKAAAFEAAATREKLAALLDDARLRVVNALRGFLPPTSEDG